MGFRDCKQTEGCELDSTETTNIETMMFHDDTCSSRDWSYHFKEPMTFDQTCFPSEDMYRTHDGSYYKVICEGDNKIKKVYYTEDTCTTENGKIKTFYISINL